MAESPSPLPRPVKSVPVSIQRLQFLNQVPQSEHLWVARVAGWDTVVNAREFSDRDLCVWHEPDTEVDRVNPIYDFLAKKQYYVGTTKIKGVMSSGLALPVSFFQERLAPVADCIQEGLDLTELLRAKHYSKPVKMDPAPLSRPWPLFAPKTAQAHLRSNPAALEELKSNGQELIFTLKMDGMSASYFYQGDLAKIPIDRWGVCSRTMRLLPSPKSTNKAYHKIAEKYAIQQRMERLGSHLVIQGEICGPRINHNVIGLAEAEFYVFHVLKIQPDGKMSQMLDYDDMVSTVEQLNAVKVDQPAPPLQLVPMIKRESMKPEETISSLVAWTNALKYENGNYAEGCVIFPAKETKSTALEGARLSVKIISEVYGLEETEAISGGK